MDLAVSISRFISGERKSLENMEKSVGLLDPLRVLARGYSITMAGGKVVKSIEDVEDGSVIKTILKDAEISSIVESRKKTR